MSLTAPARGVQVLELELALVPARGGAVADTPDPNLGVATMQELDSAKCAALPDGASGILKDVRDGKKYTVTKLSDHNCWMTQNLALEGDQTLSSDTSNLADGTTYLLPPSSESGFNQNTGQLNMYNGDSSTGAYYNARVANALTASETVFSKDYEYNICPKNWTLPTNLQLDAIYALYSRNAEPFGLIYAGSYYNGKKSFYTGDPVIGFGWSRTANSDTNFYNWNANSGGIAVASNPLRSGFSARCLVGH